MAWEPGRSRTHKNTNHAALAEPAAICAATCGCSLSRPGGIEVPESSAARVDRAFEVLDRVESLGVRAD